jgi:hypothetical protein
MEGDRAMRTLIRWAALVVLAGFVLPFAAAQDKKTDNTKPAPEKKSGAKKALDKTVNTEKSLRSGEITGKIVAVVESKKSLRLQVTYQLPQINPSAAIGYQQALIGYQQALANKDRNGIANNLMNMQINQANMYSVRTFQKDYELQTTDEVKVRLAQPPLKFDEKGKAVHHTSKELKELKGPDPKLPGYTGEFSDLANDQIVTVYLIKKKAEPGVRLPGPRVKGKDEVAAPDELPPADMILVIADPNASSK